MRRIKVDEVRIKIYNNTIKRMAWSKHGAD